jgi:hypothetical protein
LRKYSGQPQRTIRFAKTAGEIDSADTIQQNLKFFRLGLLRDPAYLTGKLFSLYTLDGQGTRTKIVSPKNWDLVIDAYETEEATPPTVYLYVKEVHPSPPTAPAPLASGI